MKILTPEERRQRGMRLKTAQDLLFLFPADIVGLFALCLIQKLQTPLATRRPKGDARIRGINRRRI